MNSMRLLAYLRERFPPVNMMLFAILYLAVFSVALEAMNFPLSFWLGIVATISFFFRLRVMDEIKDFDMDAIHHPARVLQSGGISLRTLIGLSVLLATTEVVWSYLQGPRALLFWGLALGYALLMRYEFFAATWLKQRLLVYAFSHMLVMPLVIAWLWSAWRPDFGPVLGLLMLLSLLAGFVFELARKTHAPAAERAEIETYSSLLGVRKTVWLILALLWSSLLCQALLFLQLDLPWPAYVLATACALWVSWTYRKAWSSQLEPDFRKAELATSVYMLASYVILIAGRFI